MSAGRHAARFATGLAGVLQGTRTYVLQDVNGNIELTDTAGIKSYVDTAVQGLDPKGSVTALAAQNITLSGSQTIDGVSVTPGNLVLAIGQTTATQNGLWTVATGNWTRPANFATGSAADAAYVFVEQGTVYASNGYVCTSVAGSATVDTNNLSWTQFTGAGEITPSSGLTKSGNTMSVSLASPSALQFTSGKLDTYLNPTGSIAKDTNGLRLSIVNYNTATATLSSTANGVAVLGLPNLFTVNGAATTANVSANNLSSLTAGNATLADSLHSHQSVLGSLATVGYHVCSVALAAGDPVCWSTTNNTLVRADASTAATSRVIGIAASAGASGTTVPVCKRGIATAVFSSGTAGAPVFLNTGGGMTLTAPTGSGVQVVRIGWLVNTQGDCEVAPYFLGQRSA